MASSIGIDIGNRYTKVVELEFKPAPALINEIIFRTPFLPREGPGQNQLDTKAFWERVAKHIPAERIRASKKAVNIPSSSIMALTALIPRVAKHELGIVAQTEARRRMIPASGPNHVFESAFIGEKLVAKVHRFEVLAVRTDKVYIQQALGLFREIDSVPKVITFSSCAFFTIFPPESVNKKDVDVAFVDIGLTSINTAIFKEGKLNFFRNTAFGLQDVMQDVSEHLSLTENEAEDVIKDKGVPDVDFDLKDKVAVAEEIMKQKYEASLKVSEGGQQEEINLLELRVLWQAHIERIVHELRRSLAYYKEQAEGRRVEYIYFLGGGCQIRNLILLLTEQIGGQLQVILPFKNIQLPKEKQTADYAASTPIFSNAVSLALSLTAKTRNAELINFLPVELKRKELIATRRFVLQIAKIALIFVLSLLSISTFASNRSIRLSIKGVELESKGVKKIVKKLKDLSRQDSQWKREAGQVEKLTALRQDYRLLLSKISSVVPEEVLINSITVSKADSGEAGQALDSVQGSGGQKKLEIKAQVFADYERANKIILNFRKGLEKLYFLGNIDVTPLKLEKITSSSGAAGQELRLTQPQIRTFTLKADISGSIK